MTWFDEALLRRVLGVMGFDEIKEGIFMRLDAPDRRARSPEDARFMTTVRLSDLVSKPGAIRALTQRFPRVDGAPVR